MGRIIAVQGERSEKMQIGSLAMGRSGGKWWILPFRYQTASGEMVRWWEWAISGHKSDRSRWRFLTVALAAIFIIIVYILKAQLGKNIGASLFSTARVGHEFVYTYNDFISPKSCQKAKKNFSANTRFSPETQHHIKGLRKAVFRGQIFPRVDTHDKNAISLSIMIRGRTPSSN